MDAKQGKAATANEIKLIVYSFGFIKITLHTRLINPIKYAGIIGEDHVFD